VPDEDRIRQMVRRVVYRTLGLPQSSRPVVVRPLLTEADVHAVPVGGQLAVPQGALVTPLARQVALERRVSLVEAAKAGTAPAPSVAGAARTASSPAPAGKRIVAIGTDHGGYDLKEMLKGYLGELGYEVVDCGTDSTQSVDYPDFAFAVAQLVAQGRAWRGVIVDGAGIGSCMAANKVPGVRAAMCYDQATAFNSREHNDANVLTLGAGLIGPNLARQITKTWLETPFGGGRHARRVDKIMDIERRFLKSDG
jgi:ribose 5-phosphate isomerase B